mmetsp:Transcript_6980/g.22441  ORF Transcript_6980/g.22441 Transcript_6980/m.22441 type:complete len:238 (+) Transcript_6980:104-817(+)
MYTAHWYLALRSKRAALSQTPAPTLTLDTRSLKMLDVPVAEAAGRMLAMHGMPLLRMHIIALLQPSRPAPLRSTAAPFCRRRNSEYQPPQPAASRSCRLAPPPRPTSLPAPGGRWPLSGEDGRKGQQAPSHGLPPHRRPCRGPLASAAVRHHRGAGGRERRRAARGGGARRTARGAARVGALRGPPLAGPRPAHPRPAADQGARRQGDVPRVAPRLEGDAEEAREAAPARDRRRRWR